MNKLALARFVHLCYANYCLQDRDRNEQLQVLGVITVFRGHICNARLKDWRALRAWSHTPPRPLPSSRSFHVEKQQSTVFDIWQKSLGTHRRIAARAAISKLILLGFHKHDPWLPVVRRGEEQRRGHLAADTWNDWESAACSHYLVPCIAIITPALSAPVLPSLLAIVIVIDWCGGQNSGAWKGIRHTSHNRPAIWSPPLPRFWFGVGG